MEDFACFRTWGRQMHLVSCCINGLPQTVSAPAPPLTISRSSLASPGLPLSETRTCLATAFQLNLGCLPGQEIHRFHTHMDHLPHQSQEQRPLPGRSSSLGSLHHPRGSTNLSKTRRLTVSLATGGRFRVSCSIVSFFFRLLRKKQEECERKAEAPRETDKDMTDRHEGPAHGEQSEA